MKEIIQNMREQAHQIALQRRKEWWESLTPEQRKAASKGGTTEDDQLVDFKPGVLELADAPTPYALQMQLLLLGVYVSLDDLAIKTREELAVAGLWAATVMYDASDNDVVIAPRPDWLPARDSANAVELVQDDIKKHGGEDEASRIYHEEWYTDDLVDTDPPALDHSHEPGWAQRLRAIATVLTDVCPEEMFEEGVWLLEWLNAGAPMFEPAQERDRRHHSPDTSVGEHTSTESTDGNDSGTEFGSGSVRGGELTAD